MLPTYSSGSDEFEGAADTFLGTGGGIKVNRYPTKVVLSDLDASKDGQGYISLKNLDTYHDYGPVSMNLELTFKETQFVTREMAALMAYFKYLPKVCVRNRTIQEGNHPYQLTRNIFRRIKIKDHLLGSLRIHWYHREGERPDQVARNSMVTLD